MNSKLWGSILLVTGTTIGAGMLALPVATVHGGFAAAVATLLAVWLVMLGSAYCFVELSLQLPSGTNLISMAEQTLGGWGKISAWWVYLALLYALNAAYLSSLSGLVVSAGYELWHIHMATSAVALLLVLLFVLLLCSGVRHLDWLNRLLMMGLATAFFLLVAKILPHGQLAYLSAGTASHFWWGIPVVVTSFGFHIIIPSLRRYCGDDSRKILPKAIVLGSVIPLLVYLLWQYSITSVVPHDKLLAMLESGQPAVELPGMLGNLFGHEGFRTLSRLLSFFAVTTSFIGVSLSLFDFLFDGLQLSRSVTNTLWVVLLTFLPPLGFTLFYPQGFVLALTYAGYFVSYLLIFLPAIMVWRQRQQTASPAGFQLPGGQWVLLLLVVFALAVVLVSGIQQS